MRACWRILPDALSTARSDTRHSAHGTVTANSRPGSASGAIMTGVARTSIPHAWNTGKTASTRGVSPGSAPRPVSARISSQARASTASQANSVAAAATVPTTCAS